MSLVCIITALSAESRVFIDALKLKPILDQGWRLYGNSDHLLLQTGMGKLKSAAATSAVLHHRPDISAIINVGIAGGMQEIGTVLLGHRIVDQGSGFSTYPHLPPQRVSAALPTTAIETLDKPSADYRDDVIFDMEASGIFSAASNYLSSGSMQCVKVISDNKTSPLSTFKPGDATELVKLSLPAVSQLLNWFENTTLSESIDTEVTHVVETFAAQWHHSVNDRHQLSRLLHQHYALTGCLPTVNHKATINSAAALRSCLKGMIEELPFRYGDSA